MNGFNVEIEYNILFICLKRALELSCLEIGFADLLEQNKVQRLSHHLQQIIPTIKSLFVDVEHCRYKVFQECELCKDKCLVKTRKQIAYIRQDLVVHNRVNSSMNILGIEAKKTLDKKDVATDEEKLTYLTCAKTVNRFAYGCFIRFYAYTKSNYPRCDLEIYKDSIMFAKLQCVGHNVNGTFVPKWSYL